MCKKQEEKRESTQSKAFIYINPSVVIYIYLCPPIHRQNLHGWRNVKSQEFGKSHDMSDMSWLLSDTQVPQCWMNSTAQSVFSHRQELNKCQRRLGKTTPARQHAI